MTEAKRSKEMEIRSSPTSRLPVCAGTRPSSACTLYFGWKTR